MELSLLDIFNMLFKRIWIIILVAILAFSGSYAISSFVIAPKYTSSAQLFSKPTKINDGDTGNLNELQYAQRLVDTYLALLENRSFLTEVSAKLEDDSHISYSVAQLKDIISLSAINNTEIFEVSATTESPQDSYAIVNLMTELAPGEILRVRGTDSISIVSYAILPTAPSSPNIVLNSLIGTILGIMIAVGLIFLIEMLDTRIKSEEELVAHFQLPVLGSIPEFEQK